MGHSSSSQHKSTSKSQPAVDEPSQVENTPARLVSLPRLLIVDPSHFIVDGTTITRSTFGLNWQPSPIESPLFIEKAITEGVVSVTLTILALFEIKETEGIHLGLFDSTASLSLIEDSMKRGYDQRLGCDVYNSVAMKSCHGSLWCRKSSAKHNIALQLCHSDLKNGDCVRMEVNMDSTPRTLQFFVNGAAGYSYVSGLPSSVRIGISVSCFRISFRFDRITHNHRPTPIPPGMTEIKWN
ncbi:hypothetical protein BLNAU_7142 [Blattamonas nauphoetae]|uniref:SPRY domain-containing protein n=1 Tax=Blattamonas nauphoetae TaxID=2049346 RepID=A0ABQ9Y2K9_9EUKA|nr:hypothetical protein BLNAU_7142 [Blattamonas nauphoetae]